MLGQVLVVPSLGSERGAAQFIAVHAPLRHGGIHQHEERVVVYWRASLGPFRHRFGNRECRGAGSV